MTKKRRRVFVDRQVQGALLRRLLTHWALTCVAILVYVFIMQIFIGGFDKPFSEHAAAVWAKYGILMVIMITIFPVFAYDSVKLSNRFAGPMFSFRQALSALAQGEQIRPLRFRKGDFWHEIAGDLNRISDRIQQDRAERAEAGEV